MRTLRQILLLLVAGCITHFSFSQSGTSCGTHEHDQNLKKSDPELVAKERLFDEKVRQEVIKKMQERPNPLAKTASTVYTLPVVVHIMHLPGTPVGSDENLSDAQIIQGIQELNDGLRNLNDFQVSNGVDLGIELCLAQRDTNDHPASGIVRVATAYSNLDRDADNYTMKALSYWNTSDYVNIWIVKEICKAGGTDCDLAGYASYPTSHGEFFDGIVLEASVFGVGRVNSVLPVHEFGHYLNLKHIFDDNNLCDNNDCLSDGDQVCDTPPESSGGDIIDCDLTTRNSCTSDEDDLSANNPFRPVAMGGLGDQDDMLDNHMNYGYVSCITRFTEGQKIRAVSALEVLRPSLLASQGCVPVTDPPVSEFSASTRSICSGGSIQFFDQSENGPTAWNWSFPGGTPSSSTDENPVVTYSTPGNYNVTLSTESTLGKGDTIQKQGYIYVYEDLASHCSIQLQNPDNNYGIGVKRFTFHTIDNASQGAFEEGGYVDHSCKYIARVDPDGAYPFTLEAGTTNPEIASIFIDLDNNGSFTDSGEEVWTSGGNFTGSLSDNLTIPSTAMQNTLLTMRVYSDFGTSISPCSDANYGQAEDYGLYVTNDVITSTAKAKSVEISVVPNPFSSHAEVNLSYVPGSETVFTISNVMGHEVRSIPVDQPAFRLDQADLEPGIYFYRLSAGGEVVAAGKMVVKR